MRHDRDDSGANCYLALWSLQPLKRLCTFCELNSTGVRLDAALPNGLAGSEAVAVSVAVAACMYKVL